MCCKFVYAAERGHIEGQAYEFIHYPGSWCKHVLLKGGEKGCTLHGTPRKPIVCRTFSCLWLMGFGHEEDRPDKINVIGSVEPRGPIGEEMETFLVVYNCAPEAWRSKRAERFMIMVGELFETHSAQGLEIVPFDPEAKVRHGLHKVHGNLEIHVPGGFPEPLDADAERADLASLFGGELPADLGTQLLMEAMNRLPEAERKALGQRLRSRMR